MAETNFDDVIRVFETSRLRADVTFAQYGALLFTDRDVTPGATPTQSAVSRASALSVVHESVALHANVSLSSKFLETIRDSASNVLQLAYTPARDSIGKVFPVIGSGLRIYFQSQVFDKFIDEREIPTGTLIGSLIGDFIKDINSKGYQLRSFVVWTDDTDPYIRLTKLGQAITAPGLFRPVKVRGPAPTVPVQLTPELILRRIRAIQDDVTDAGKRAESGLKFALTTIETTATLSDQLRELVITTTKTQDNIRAATEHLQRIQSDLPKLFAGPPPVMLNWPGDTEREAKLRWFVSMTRSLFAFRDFGPPTIQELVIISIGFADAFKPDIVFGADTPPIPNTYPEYFATLSDDDQIVLELINIEKFTPSSAMKPLDPTLPEHGKTLRLFPEKLDPGSAPAAYTKLYDNFRTFVAQFVRESRTAGALPTWIQASWQESIRTATLAGLFELARDNAGTWYPIGTAGPLGYLAEYTRDKWKDLQFNDLFIVVNTMVAIHFAISLALLFERVRGGVDEFDAMWSEKPDMLGDPPTTLSPLASVASSSAQPEPVSNSTSTDVVIDVAQATTSTDGAASSETSEHSVQPSTTPATHEAVEEYNAMTPTERGEWFSRNVDGLTSAAASDNMTAAKLASRALMAVARHRNAARTSSGEVEVDSGLSSDAHALSVAFESMRSQLTSETSRSHIGRLMAELDAM